MRRLLPAREVIGVPECPLIYRWTLVARGRVKLMVHHFLPESRDRDAHDHPRPFWTLVLRGEYIDEGHLPDGRVVYERMRPGTLRYRPARHTHKTFSERGCWTLVLMGPQRREWGFRRDGAWWPYRLYEELFGHGFRCEP